MIWPIKIALKTKTPTNEWPEIPDIVFLNVYLQGGLLYIFIRITSYLQFIYTCINIYNCIYIQSIINYIMLRTWE